MRRTSLTFFNKKAKMRSNIAKSGVNFYSKSIFQRFVRKVKAISQAPLFWSRLSLLIFAAYLMDT